MSLKFLEECIKNTYHDITTSVLKKDMNKIHVHPHTFNFFSTWSDKFDFKNFGLNILFYSHVRFDVYNCANVEHHVLKSNKFFRIGITNKREDYKTLSDEYVSYIDESDVFNVIHILEQLYADTQQYELSSDKYNRDLISFGAKLWQMTLNGSVNADVHFGKTLSVYGADKPRKQKAVNNLPPYLRLIRQAINPVLI